MDLAAGPTADAIDRDALVPFVRGLLARADALPPDALRVRRFRLAGLEIEVRAADANLGALYEGRLGVRPHAAPDPPDLVLDVLDSASLGWEAPPLWGDGLFWEQSYHGRLRRAGLAASYPGERRMWQVLDLARGRGVLWVDRPADLPPWDAGAPLRGLLQEVMPSRGARLCHAGTVAHDGVGVLLAGSGGAGKSGTTLAALAAGLSTVGDDYVALRLEPRPRAQCLYRTIKQDPAGLARVAGLPPGLAAGPLTWHGKVEMMADVVFPGRLVGEIALGGIVLPRITGGSRSSFPPLPAAEALRTLLFANVGQSIADPAEGMRFFARLVRDLPCWRLELSADAAEVGARLGDFLAGLAP